PRAHARPRRDHGARKKCALGPPLERATRVYIDRMLHRDLFHRRRTLLGKTAGNLRAAINSTVGAGLSRDRPFRLRVSRAGARRADRGRCAPTESGYSFIKPHYRLAGRAAPALSICGMIRTTASAYRAILWDNDGVLVDTER